MISLVMTTYVLSQHTSYWHVARYEDETSGQPVIKTPSEKDALEAVLKEAKIDTPSQVLRIALSGESHIIAKFDS
jgi:hypothetical protein